MMTGRYPHHNGGEGFQPIRTDVPTLQERLRAAGYLNGILGKVDHLAPQGKFCCDYVRGQAQLGMGRDPAAYGRAAAEFLRTARSEGRPFFLMANSHDPHRPFSGSRNEASIVSTQSPFPKPSKTYSPEETVVPGFLPDIPGVREEVAQYNSSARRLDDTVGSVLKALEESGMQDSTLVMFLSDNGMSFPFAKTNCYLNSTRTPWIVRWPGKVKPGSVNTDDFITGIDFTPTIVEACALEAMSDLDGRSFLPLLTGAAQPGRDTAVTVFHETSARRRYEMRCVQGRQFGYIFNAWADGKTRFQNEGQSGLSMKSMLEAAKDDPSIAARVKLFLYRAPEELYDISSDPDALTNLCEHGAPAGKLADMRSRMLTWMKQTGDPLAALYEEFLKSGKLPAQTRL